MRILCYSSILLVPIIIFVIVVFPALETTKVFAATTANVNASQQITSEISLSVASNSLTLAPIQGLTGGTSDIATIFTIITNNRAGYGITFQASTTVNATSAMQGITPSLGPGYIKDYAATIPEDWVNTSAGQASQFGFGIINSGAPNLAAGYASCNTIDSCFSKSPTTTPKQIVNTNKPTGPSGDGVTLKFRVHIPPNSNPLVPQDWYSATSTITAVLN